MLRGGRLKHNRQVDYREELTVYSHQVTLILLAKMTIYKNKGI